MVVKDTVSRGTVSQVQISETSPANTSRQADEVTASREGGYAQGGTSVSSDLHRHVQTGLTHARHANPVAVHAEPDSTPIQHNSVRTPVAYWQSPLIASAVAPSHALSNPNTQTTNTSFSRAADIPVQYRLAPLAVPPTAIPGTELPVVGVHMEYSADGTVPAVAASRGMQTAMSVGDAAGAQHVNAGGSQVPHPGVHGALPGHSEKSARLDSSTVAIPREPATVNSLASSEYKIAPYIILGEVLGVGSFGKVKRAVHERTGRHYACKIMDKDLVRARVLSVQVRKEIDIMRRLKHPNIVRMYDVRTTHTKIFIFMELVTGGELFDEILRYKRLSECRARFYFEQLIKGLSHCHECGIYHRDLKPENLLLDENKQLKISDFGLSFLKRGDKASEISSSSTSSSYRNLMTSSSGAAMSTSGLLHTQCGTPNYVAPEIISMDSRGYSGPKVDAWACGIILYVLVAGALPFDADDMSTLFKLILRCDISYPPFFSAPLIDLISNVLKPDPVERYRLSDVLKHEWMTMPGSKLAEISLAAGGRPVELEDDLAMSTPEHSRGRDSSGGRVGGEGHRSGGMAQPVADRIASGSQPAVPAKIDSSEGLAVADGMQPPRETNNTLDSLDFRLRADSILEEIVVQANTDSGLQKGIRPIESTVKELTRPAHKSVAQTASSSPGAQVEQTSTSSNATAVEAHSQPAVVSLEPQSDGPAMSSGDSDPVVRACEAPAAFSVDSAKASVAPGVLEAEGDRISAERSSFEKEVANGGRTSLLRKPSLVDCLTEPATGNSSSFSSDMGNLDNDYDSSSPLRFRSCSAPEPVSRYRAQPIGGGQELFGRGLDSFEDGLTSPPPTPTIGKQGCASAEMRRRVKRELWRGACKDWRAHSATPHCSSAGLSGLNDSRAGVPRGGFETDIASHGVDPLVRNMADGRTKSIDSEWTAHGMESEVGPGEASSISREAQLMLIASQNVSLRSGTELGAESGTSIDDRGGDRDRKNVCTCIPGANHVRFQTQDSSLHARKTGTAGLLTKAQSYDDSTLASRVRVSVNGRSGVKSRGVDRSVLCRRPTVPSPLAEEPLSSSDFSLSRAARNLSRLPSEVSSRTDSSWIRNDMDKMVWCRMMRDFDLVPDEVEFGVDSAALNDIWHEKLNEALSADYAGQRRVSFYESRFGGTSFVPSRVALALASHANDGGHRVDSHGGHGLYMRELGLLSAGMDASMTSTPRGVTDPRLGALDTAVLSGLQAAAEEALSAAHIAHEAGAAVQSAIQEALAVSSIGSQVRGSSGVGNAGRGSSSRPVYETAPPVTSAAYLPTNMPGSSSNGSLKSPPVVRSGSSPSGSSPRSGLIWGHTGSGSHNLTGRHPYASGNDLSPRGSTSPLVSPEHGSSHGIQWKEPTSRFARECRGERALRGSYAHDLTSTGASEMSYGYADWAFHPSGSRASLGVEASHGFVSHHPIVGRPDGRSAQRAVKGFIGGQETTRNSHAESSSSGGNDDGLGSNRFGQAASGDRTSQQSTKRAPANFSGTDRSRPQNGSASPGQEPLSSPSRSSGTRADFDSERSHQDRGTGGAFVKPEDPFKINIPGPSTGPIKPPPKSKILSSIPSAGSARRRIRAAPLNGKRFTSFRSLRCPKWCVDTLVRLLHVQGASQVQVSNGKAASGTYRIKCVAVQGGHPMLVTIDVYKVEDDFCEVTVKRKSSVDPNRYISFYEAIYELFCEFENSGTISTEQHQLPSTANQSPVTEPSDSLSASSASSERAGWRRIRVPSMAHRASSSRG